MAALVSVPQQRREGQSELRRFRNDLYDCFSARADALFDVLDAVCTPVAVDGIAHLSLASSARRGHGGLYAALADGRIDTGLIRDVLAAHRPLRWRPDFAVDATTWPRCDAECSAGRGMYHHPSRHRFGSPVISGWCYQWVAGISGRPDSWTAPVDARRLAVTDNQNLVAVQQIEALLPRLYPVSETPLFVFDAGYDPVQITHELRGESVQVLVRVRNDRQFFARPSKDWNWPSRNSGGRPPLHGARFSCSDESTWPQPDNTIHRDDDRYGHVTVTEWRGLHPMQKTYRDNRNQMRIIDCNVLRVTAERLPGMRARTPKMMWLWWAGPAGSIPDLDRVFQAYLRRFDVEHSFRFAKQVLGWTTPKLRTPEQADRWTWIIAAAFTQLRLARPLVADHRLPWQKPLPPNKMTPGRVRAGFGHLLPHIGTPATWPKPSHPGPGRPKGRTSTPAPRYPAQRKHQVKHPYERTSG